MRASSKVIMLVERYAGMPDTLAAVLEQAISSGELPEKYRSLAERLKRAWVYRSKMDEIAFKYMLYLAGIPVKWEPNHAELRIISRFYPLVYNGRIYVEAPHSMVDREYLKKVLAGYLRTRLTIRDGQLCVGQRCAQLQPLAAARVLEKLSMLDRGDAAPITLHALSLMVPPGFSARINGDAVIARGEVDGVKLEATMKPSSDAVNITVKAVGRRVTLVSGRMVSLNDAQLYMTRASNLMARNVRLLDALADAAERMGYTVPDHVEYDEKSSDFKILAEKKLTSNIRASIMFDMYAVRGMVEGAASFDAEPTLPSTPDYINIRFANINGKYVGMATVLLREANIYSMEKFVRTVDRMAEIVEEIAYLPAAAEHVARLLAHRAGLLRLQPRELDDAERAAGMVAEALGSSNAADPLETLVKKHYITVGENGEVIVAGKAIDEIVPGADDMVLAYLYRHYRTVHTKVNTMLMSRKGLTLMEKLLRGGVAPPHGLLMKWWDSLSPELKRMAIVNMLSSEEGRQKLLELLHGDRKCLAFLARAAAARGDANLAAAAEAAAAGLRVIKLGGFYAIELNGFRIIPWRADGPEIMFIVARIDSEKGVVMKAASLAELIERIEEGAYTREIAEASRDGIELEILGYTVKYRYMEEYTRDSMHGRRVASSAA